VFAKERNRDKGKRKKILALIFLGELFKRIVYRKIFGKQKKNSNKILKKKISLEF